MARKAELQTLSSALVVRVPPWPSDQCHPSFVHYHVLLRGHSNLQRLLDAGLCNRIYSLTSFQPRV